MSAAADPDFNQASTSNTTHACDQLTDPCFLCRSEAGTLLQAVC